VKIGVKWGWIRGCILVAQTHLSTREGDRVNRWIKNIHHIVVPPVCVLCGASGANELDLCVDCRRDLPRLRNGCARCALPLSSSTEALCGACQHQPPAFERCLSLFNYQPPVDHLLLGLKFHSRLELARVLGQLMARWLTYACETPPGLLIPVPLHPQRLRERGFNQALELARPIARALNLPLDVHRCHRRHMTTAQMNLPRSQRLKNVKGAFGVNGPVSGHVVIVDDVMTTGSTAHELAKCLLNAGASSVEVWVYARTS